jgi:Protein of unknown function (DUF1360)
MKTLESKISGEVNGYGRGQPLPQFALLILIQSVIQLLLISLSRAGRYPTVRFRDLVLLGIGTHKLSRIVAKDRVTAPLRVPFTRFEKSAGSGEVEEAARGSGLKGVIGELVSCPYCMSVWVASGLLLLFIINRRLARLVCKLLTMITASHFLHRFYMRMEPQQ